MLTPASRATASSVSPDTPPRSTVRTAASTNRAFVPVAVIAWSYRPDGRSQDAVGRRLLRVKPPAPEIALRSVTVDDLPTFFAHQLDAEASRMAAFTAKDPTDEDAFGRHWTTLLADDAVLARTVVVDGEVAGHVVSYQQLGQTEVTYWIARRLWGRGIATAALAAFLQREQPARPLHARAAKDNTASLHVLQRCGFVIVGEDHGFANARATDVEEYLLELRA